MVEQGSQSSSDRHSKITSLRNAFYRLADGVMSDLDGLIRGNKRRSRALRDPLDDWYLLGRDMWRGVSKFEDQILNGERSFPDEQSRIRAVLSIQRRRRKDGIDSSDSG